jgi:hypothetical protein
MYFRQFLFCAILFGVVFCATAQQHGEVDPILPPGRAEWPAWTDAERSSVQREPLAHLTLNELALYLTLGEQLQMKCTAPCSATESARSSVAPLGTVSDPRELIGRFTFIKSARGHYCTAQIVGGKGDVILTAAHCIRSAANPEVKYRKFEFIRAYGGANAQVFAVRCAATWSTFPSAKRPNYGVDYAFAKLGAPFRMALGVTPEIFNGEFPAMGYPQNMNGGHTLSTVRGRVQDMTGGILQMKPNTMGDGASGGGWINETSLMAFSLNSFRVNGERQQVYGPAFDETIVDLFNYVENDCK